MSHHALIPMPIELLMTPPLLDGSAGTNRAPSFIIQQIAAKNDLQAIQAWLAEFTKSPQTLRSYRKEAERLLLWSLIEKQKPFSSLTRDDLRDYHSFLSNPTPHARWCGPRKLRQDLNWKPFQGSLSDHSIAQAITVINALFSYLVEAGYLSGNPLGLMRRKTHFTSNQAPVIERFLEQNLWLNVIEHIESLPQATFRQQKEYERTRFLFHLLYLLAPRVSEVSGALMKHVQHIRGKWWWQILGKGQKLQLIPVNNAALDALIRYRTFYQLAPLPQPDEDKPLFMNINGTKAVSSNMIYRLVKKIFQDCAANFAKTRPDVALKLAKASTHWLRHTAITHQADAGIELRYIKRSARHESVETTMLYQHAEDDKWHEAMALHRINNSGVEC